MIHVPHPLCGLSGSAVGRQQTTEAPVSSWGDLEAMRQFSGFCAEIGILDLPQVEPVHVAAYTGALDDSFWRAIFSAKAH